MNQHLIVHMMSSVDGRILLDSWTTSPDGSLDDWQRQYSQVLESLKVDCYLLGKNTVAEMVGGQAHPPSAYGTPNRPVNLASTDQARYAVTVDKSGTLHFRAAALGTDPILVVLGSDVSDEHLAELVADGVSYLLIDPEAFEAKSLLAALGRIVPSARIALLGGGMLNGSFLAAGLVKEISLLVMPAVGGDNPLGPFQAAIPSNIQLSLHSVEQIGSGTVHLRYEVMS